jgi:hypothetical protein
MNSSQAWNIIINKLSGNRLEFPTVPKVRRDPVWFSATTDRDFIYINRAIDNVPSSELTHQRKLKYSTFLKVYPLFLRREKGESVSKEVTSVTVNQVYYFSLIKHLCLND